MSDVIGIEHDRVTNTTSTDFPGYSTNGEQHAWDLDTFKSQLRVDIKHITEREANFDLINIDTSIANAFRRIMLAEVPSVAAEHVYVYNNTSVVQDEVLAHRIGMIPLKVDPELLSWVDPNAPEDGKFTDDNTIVLSLDVQCKEKDKTMSVYARDLVFEPQGRQVEVFADQPVVPCDPDILLVKLRYGQEVSLRVHCILGLGSDHAKFSPVSTASYRLLPQIDIIQPITGTDAQKFQKCFPSGVIGIDSKGQAFVADPRKDTVSREVLRHDEFNGKVKLGRKRTHFIYNVESTGAIPPEEIFFRSVRILKNKAEYLKSCPIN
ncbi:unnamed protein product [Kuraishia capsulata CBS 1993]|uniref:DNA-directed RNA polymerases I and III subunit RPAC1 n=1 Tax=Kuraishia capsulata CBS 1993 TaxID=1382522 RepID=W6MRC2_9ASCO|nr:uncharacterized protein KUCA_T00005274001 [Kuraishia capsulata CBS 1993]CDK29286.1 unnamed protein product [Kuraishia capsulata CBS 1993]